ncbi:fungal hydrophobin-domain-containing protein [Trametes polyzona]|nr:fungal hydrophobin-domain-containing protein [Trametes polyzona]
MFARLPAVATFASLAVLAVATPAKRWDTHTTTPPAHTTTVTVTAPPTTITVPAGGQPSCSTGPIQCCNSLEKSSSDAGSFLLGLLGVVVEGLDALIGLQCSPLSVVGVGAGNSCSANTVCCENNNVGGLISIGCIPIIL